MLNVPANKVDAGVTFWCLGCLSFGQNNCWQDGWFNLLRLHQGTYTTHWNKHTVGMEYHCLLMCWFDIALRVLVVLLT